MTRPIALATCDPLPVEADESAIEAALSAAGVPYEWAVWDDPGVAWAGFAAVVIRTTWDYHRRLDEYLAWARAVGAVTSLWNPAELVVWNSHKGYLADLAAAGIVTVPTEVVPAAGPCPPLGEIVAARGWPPGGEVVVKPAVSVGSLGASRGPSDDPSLHAALAALVAEGDALVQPFLPEVTTAGEVSTVFVDGAVTHALRKVPSAGDYRSQPEWGGRLEGIPPRRDCVALGRDALAAVADRFGVEPLYARVDTIDLDGRPHLIELEIIEPDLFFGFGPPEAAAAFAAALRRLSHA